ncbi:MAG: hypothetical protein ACXW4L_05700 [Candidatus Limnocylindrales bacterium]
MFDLNPDVEHLMLDLPHATAAPSPSGPAPSVEAPAAGPRLRLRSALGRRLIVIGAALAADDGVARRSIAR